MTTTAPTAAPPLTPSDNCDYSQADMFNGYGWDNVALESCPPLDSDNGNPGDNGNTGDDGDAAGSCPTGFPANAPECQFNLVDSGSFSSVDNGSNSALPIKQDPTITITDEAGRDGGGFRTRCLVSHFSYADALVNFQEPTQDGAHLHMFFGNTGTDADSVNGGTVSTGPNHLLNNNSTCGDLGQHNKSAYWVPALFNRDGDPVVPDQINVYYKTLNNNNFNNLYVDEDEDLIPEVLDGMRPIPNDLRMISHDGELSVQNHSGSNWMVLRIEFQNCIRVDNDGSAASTAGIVTQGKHQANYTMSKHNVRNDNGSCGPEDSDWVRIPGLEFNIQWKIESGNANKIDQGDWAFSNGVSTFGRVEGLHGDYMAAWEGNDSWNTETGSFTDRTTDAMSELVDWNQTFRSSLFDNEFENLQTIRDLSANVIADSGGKNSLSPVVDLRLDNGSAIPCSIGGHAAPNCTHHDHDHD